MPKGIYKRTKPAWNRGIKGKIFTEETKRRMSEARKGLRHSKETKKKMSEAKIGKPSNTLGKHWKLSEETKKRLSEALGGRKHTQETRKKMRDAKLKNPTRYWLGKKRPQLVSSAYKKTLKERWQGEKNPNWQNGKSFEPYGLKFNNELKEQIRQRDDFTCQECNYKQEQLKGKLLVHHIDYNKKNNVLSNLISLCRSCHCKTNFKRDDWTNYFKGRLSNLQELNK